MDMESKLIYLQGMLDKESMEVIQSQILSFFPMSSSGFISINESDPEIVEDFYINLLVEGKPKHFTINRKSINALVDDGGW